MPAEKAKSHKKKPASSSVFTGQNNVQLLIEQFECQWDVDVLICVNVCMPVKELNPDQTQVSGQKVVDWLISSCADVHRGLTCFFFSFTPQNFRCLSKG